MSPFKGPLSTKKAQSIEEMEICTVCNLEDVRTQFEYESRCDCQCVVHRRCPEMASPYSEHSEFCPLCTAYLPLEQLRARRKWSEESGDFEVESVVDYDRGHNDYIVKWKGYPPAAILKATSFSISHLHQRGTSAPSFSLSLSVCSQNKRTMEYQMDSKHGPGNV